MKTARQVWALPLTAVTVMWVADAPDGAKLPAPSTTASANAPRRVRRTFLRCAFVTCVSSPILVLPPPCP
ncbi:MAG: hypothetical protein M3404_00975, partial [Actinomycetota bacterium]|nr:hypothetical protein [Actinomycetota bacterium]